MVGEVWVCKGGGGGWRCRRARRGQVQVVLCVLCWVLMRVGMACAWMWTLFCEVHRLLLLRRQRMPNWGRGRSGTVNGKVGAGASAKFEEVCRGVAMALLRGQQEWWRRAGSLRWVRRPHHPRCMQAGIMGCTRAGSNTTSSTMCAPVMSWWRLSWWCL